MAKRTNRAGVKKNRKPSVVLTRRAPGTSLVVLRRGSAIGRVTVLNKEFSIETEDVGTLRIKTKAINTIVLKNGPLFPLDVVRLRSGDISGTVTTDPVKIESDQIGGKKDIPLAQILTISF